MSPSATMRYEWKDLPWRTLEVQVFKLQKRIYQASRRSDVKTVHTLQRLLMKSWAAKCLAVRKVTQENQGKKIKVGRPSMEDRIMKGVALAAAVLVCAVSAPAAHAEWPDHPIHWVVPFGPGGANDLIARVAAEAASKKLGQPIVIENRPGATTGTQAVARASAGGYLSDRRGGRHHQQPVA